VSEAVDEVGGRYVHRVGAGCRASLLCRQTRGANQLAVVHGKGNATDGTRAMKKLWAPINAV
jgi:hypothetical protein